MTIETIKNKIAEVGLTNDIDVRITEEGEGHYAMEDGCGLHLVDDIDELWYLVQDSIESYLSLEC